MVSKKLQINPISNFLFWNYLYGVGSVTYGVGIFYGWFIEKNYWSGFSNIIAAIIFFFIGYKIKLKPSIKLVVISLIIAGLQVIWVASMYNYFTPLPYIPWFFALSTGYRLYKSMKNNELKNIQSAHSNS